MTTLADIKKAAASLNQKDMEALRDYCNLILGSSFVVSSTSGVVAAAAEPSPKEKQEERLYIAVSKTLWRATRTQTQPYPIYKRVPENRRRLTLATDTLVAFCDNTLNKYTDLVFVSVCTRFSLYTVEDLKAYEIPVTMKNVLQASSRWGDTFDRRFPGYIQAGLTHLVFTTANRLKNRH
jgi:hypothetical protein